MNIEYYNLYCKHCSGFRAVAAEKVSIHLDLEENEYGFSGTCGCCGNSIINYRRTDLVGKYSGIIGVNNGPKYRENTSGY